MKPAICQPTLPSVVQVGFSGSRELFKGVLVDSPSALNLCVEAEQWFEQRLARIGSELRLQQNQFLVGISQIACGADFIFTRVCHKQSVPQRIFLPQHRKLFLEGAGSDRTPDFTPRQRTEAETLLTSSHIIQESVVAWSPDRAMRFEETNLEIMRVSDALVCLLRAEADGKHGGTHQLLDRAIQRGIPILELAVAEKNGKLDVVRDQWHNLDERTDKSPRNLPEDMARIPFPGLQSGRRPMPQRDEYCDALGAVTKRLAGRKQLLFKLAAALIISTHVAATVLAALALAMHEFLSHWIILGVLLLEFVLLLTGFSAHYAVHHSRTVKQWAISRVIHELVRSLRAIGSRHIYLEHLFRLHLPHRYRPLLRTLSVLHLQATRLQRDLPWQPQRDRYVRERFDDPQEGQIHFFQRALQKDQRLMQICQRIFIVCSLLAMVATAYKIHLLCDGGCAKVWLALIGALAVTLPVLAVGGLSWSAAIDCEGRVETFGEVLQFLLRQKPLLELAASEMEFDQLLLETETALLGEVTNWYSRRSSKGVT